MSRMDVPLDNGYHIRHVPNPCLLTFTQCITVGKHFHRGLWATGTQKIVFQVIYFNHEV